MVNDPQAVACVTSSGEPKEPAWLEQILVCPGCRRGGLQIESGARHCRQCQVAFPIGHGIHYLIPPNWREASRKHRIAWQRFGTALRLTPLSMEEALRLPDSASTRTLLEWLRARLAARGPCRVLELGAGRGWASRALAVDGHQVVASDVQDDEEVGLRFATRLRDSKVPWFGCVAAGGEALPFQNESFDCIFCFSTLRHIVDLEAVLCEASRVLKPGGLFLAFEEPFRGGLTTTIERLQNSTCHKLARWWQPGKLPSTARGDIVRYRECFGSTFYELARRPSFYATATLSAGLRPSVLPIDALLAVPPTSPRPADELATSDNWLSAFAEAYGLQVDRLRTHLDQLGELGRQELLAELMAHWVGVGNVEGVLVAEKRAAEACSLPRPERCRMLDPLLLSCTANEFVPVHGFYPPQADEEGTYYWLQPHSALLVRSAESVELAVALPPRSFCRHPVHIHVQIENESSPRLIFLALPGKTVTFRVPLRQPKRQQSSLLLRLTSSVAFMPSDHPDLAGDTRLLGLKLRNVRVHGGEAIVKPGQAA